MSLPERKLIPVTTPPGAPRVHRGGGRPSVPEPDLVAKHEAILILPVTTRTLTNLVRRGPADRLPACREHGQLLRRLGAARSRPCEAGPVTAAAPAEQYGRLVILERVGYRGDKKLVLRRCSCYAEVIRQLSNVWARPVGDGGAFALARAVS